VLGNLPSPSVYEQEYAYWPWGRLIKITTDYVAERAEYGASVLDYMCGTGFLLNEIALRRPDLRLFGCSLGREYIDYAHQKYPHLEVVLHNALDFQPPVRPQIVICTAGLHHLSRAEQPVFLRKVAEELCEGGLFLVGEELVADYQNEQQRQEAVVDLSYSLLRYAIRQGAPKPILEAAVGVLAADLLEVEEFKTSLVKLKALLDQSFAVDAVQKTWPFGVETFGDFLFSLSRKRSV